MLNINLEFVRGMLFVRLDGVLDNNTYTKLSDCLYDMIHDKGLKYFVLNLKGIAKLIRFCVAYLRRWLKSYVLRV